MGFNPFFLKNRRKFFSVVVFLLATLYLFYVSIPGYKPAMVLLQKISITNLVLALVSAVVMLLLKAIYHLLLMRQLTLKHYHFSDIVPSYLQSQIVRYLPGKIWGLVYQSQQLKGQASGSIVILVNLFQLLNTNLLSVGVIFAVIVGQLYGILWLSLALIFFVLLTELLHCLPYYQMLVVKILTKFLKRFKQSLPGQSLRALPMRGTLILLLEWVCFFLVFYLLFHHSYTSSEVLLVAVWYASASLIAILAIVIPAGLVVREAIFIAGSSLLPVDNSAFVAVAAILRLVLLAAEFLAIPLGSCLGKIFKHDS